MRGGAWLSAGVLLAAALLLARRAQAAPGTPAGGPAPVLSATQLAALGAPVITAPPLVVDVARIPPGPPSVMDRVSMFLGDAVDAVKAALKPRGIRNNNPGNLRPGSPWVGAIGQDGGYLIFDTPENGIRALGRNLLTYYRRHGLDTVAGIIERWAPAVGRDPVTGKTYTQPTPAYVRAVAAALKVAPDERINVAARLPELVPAIIRHENGQQPYPPAVLGEGIRRALA